VTSDEQFVWIRWGWASGAGLTAFGGICAAALTGSFEEIPLASTALVAAIVALAAGAVVWQMVEIWHVHRAR
jgi:hypothetical protein